jgi:hypothetical protein
MSMLVSNNGGKPIVALATREVVAEDNGYALKFVSEVREGRLDIVIFLTGVGTRALAQAVEGICPREESYKQAKTSCLLVVTFTSSTLAPSTCGPLNRFSKDTTYLKASA